jgi:hypothetical protein
MKMHLCLRRSQLESGEGQIQFVPSSSTVRREVSKEKGKLAGLTHTRPFCGSLHPNQTPTSRSYVLLKLQVSNEGSTVLGNRKLSHSLESNIVSFSDGAQRGVARPSRLKIVRVFVLTLTSSQARISVKSNSRSCKNARYTCSSFSSDFRKIIRSGMFWFQVRTAGLGKRASTSPRGPVGKLYGLRA